MYYEEQIINGVLCHRGTPDGEWVPFTAEELTAKLVEAKDKCRDLEVQLEDEIEERGMNGKPTMD